MQRSISRLTLRALGSCTTIEDEYWYHVSEQDELPLAAGSPRTSTLADLDKLADSALKRKMADVESVIADALLKNPNLINELRLLVAISDKRLYLDLSYIFSRTLDPADPNQTLSGEPPHKLTRHTLDFFERILETASTRPERAKVAAGIIAALFIAKGLAAMLRLYASQTQAGRELLVSALIAPKESQQNEAKRRGHGAESYLASFLTELGISFKPENKVQNPMGSHDPNIDRRTFEIVARKSGDTWSFDLLAFANDKLRVCVQGLVQSSDPGQFGVNKTNETIDIRKDLDRYNATCNASQQIQLWGLVDGVGYCENKNGTINKMLPFLHEFIEINSVYKVALALHKMKLCVVRAIRFHSDCYAESTRNEMAQRYVPPEVSILNAENEANADWKAIAGGFATIYIDSAS